MEIELTNENLIKILKILDAADRLAKSKGHIVSCSFKGCNCGAVEEQKIALTDYWVERRKLD